MCAKFGVEQELAGVLGHGLVQATSVIFDLKGEDDSTGSGGSCVYTSDYLKAGVADEGVFISWNVDMQQDPNEVFFSTIGDLESQGVDPGGPNDIGAQTGRYYTASAHGVVAEDYQGATISVSTPVAVPASLLDDIARRTLKQASTLESGPAPTSDE